MRFVDLFAGVGGFNVGLTNAGHECVGAYEIDDELRRLYESNFPNVPIWADVENIGNEEKLPAFDILCAGFPCQPYSKAGKQLAENDQRGVLLAKIVEIIHQYKPRAFILENVPNFEKVEGGRIFRKLIDECGALNCGYKVVSKVFTPESIGIPGRRKRLYILGFDETLEFGWPTPLSISPMSFQKSACSHDLVPDRYLSAFDIWEEFLVNTRNAVGVPSHPIWSKEFGATYPIAGFTPKKYLASKQGRALFTSCLGEFGKTISHDPSANKFRNIPSYADYGGLDMPVWKTRFIQKNRDLWNSLGGWKYKWRGRIMELTNSLQKLEWNWKEAPHFSLYSDVIIQIRSSGIRVKSPDAMPSLTAMSSTQIPIIGRARDEKRYLSVQEAASLHGLEHLPTWPSRSAAFHALGNSVSAPVVEKIIQGLKYKP